MSIKLIDESTIAEDKLFDTTEGIQSKGLVKPIHLLKFAKWILSVIGMIYLFACITEIFYPSNAVFEACKVTLPSFAALVIGYYFGNNK